MPPGGEGFYYLTTYLLVQDGELGYFDIEFNGEMICEAYAEQIGTTTDEITTSCSGIVYGTEGKKLNFSLFLQLLNFSNSRYKSDSLLIFIFKNEFDSDETEINFILQY